MSKQKTNRQVALLINKKIFTVINFGCRVNTFESNLLIDQFSKIGYIFTSDLKLATLFIVNTCCVTSKAESKCLSTINKITRLKNCQQIIVCGCLSELNKDAFKSNKKIILVAGTKNKHKMIDAYLKKNKTYFCSQNNISAIIAVNGNKTRAYIRIQDGCKQMCSYCIVPYVRNPPISLDIDEIKNGIIEYIKQGYYEIVITGINISSYQFKKYNFLDVLKMINKIPGNFRVRISSLEPYSITKEILNLIINNPRFCQSLHLCLQNGSDKILNAMNRKYQFSDFFKIIKFINQKNPFFSVTTDIIIGFPTETTQTFQESVDNIKKCHFAKMHIFPYSKRPNTISATLKNQVTTTTKKK
jgi:threonylcarbamoyladenosine tRNA methylthiotransferase MtaB